MITSLELEGMLKNSFVPFLGNERSGSVAWYGSCFSFNGLKRSPKSIFTLSAAAVHILCLQGRDSIDFIMSHR